MSAAQALVDLGDLEADILRHVPGQKARRNMRAKIYKIKELINAIVDGGYIEVIEERKPYRKLRIERDD